MSQRSHAPALHRHRHPPRLGPFSRERVRSRGIVASWLCDVEMQVALSRTWPRECDRVRSARTGVPAAPHRRSAPYYWPACADTLHDYPRNLPVIDCARAIIRVGPPIANQFSRSVFSARSFNLSWGWMGAENVLRCLALHSIFSFDQNSG